MTSGRFLQLSGAACVLAVILMHVFEAFHIFPGMGWGLPNSAGHYLDLSSAILAITLLPLGFAVDARKRRNRKLKDCRPAQRGITARRACSSLPDRNAELPALVDP
jgi:hypothetical protein